MASTQTDRQGGSQLLGLMLVLGIYLGLSRMIISVSVPATGFFTCKSPLFLSRGNNCVTSQAVYPRQSMSGVGRGSWLLAHAGTLWQGCAWVRSCRHTPLSLTLGACEQPVVWVEAGEHGVALSLPIHVQMLGNCSALSTTSASVPSVLPVPLCSPDDFALGQIQPKDAQPGKGH